MTLDTYWQFCGLRLVNIAEWFSLLRTVPLISRGKARARKNVTNSISPMVTDPLSPMKFAYISYAYFDVVLIVLFVMSTHVL